MCSVGACSCDSMPAQLLRQHARGHWFDMVDISANDKLQCGADATTHKLGIGKQDA